MRVISKLILYSKALGQGHVEKEWKTKYLWVEVDGSLGVGFGRFIIEALLQKLYYN